MDNFHRSILDNLQEGVYVVDRSRRITFWNGGAEAITGFEPNAVIGRSCSHNILNHVDDAGKLLCKDRCPLAEVMEDGKPRSVEVYLHHRDGHRVPVRVQAVPLLGDEGEIIGAVETFVDNSETNAARQKIDELQQLALIDPLTAIGNRRYLEMNLQASLFEFQRYDWPFGLLFMDVDDFKRINDEYGHEIGDQVLQMVARTLDRNMRSFDFLGRWGGEEFVAVLVNVDREHLLRIAERFRALVEASFMTIGEAQIDVTLSIGASLVQPGDGMDTVLERADRAMYRSKEAGRNRVSGPEA
jgi:diguanylate cyclase (GGDEF)-like protein/PAS domain S-box-containing protein